MRVREVVLLICTAAMNFYRVNWRITVVQAQFAQKMYDGVEA